MKQALRSVLGNPGLVLFCVVISQVIAMLVALI